MLNEEPKKKEKQESKESKNSSRSDSSIISSSSSRSSSKSTSKGKGNDQTNENADNKVNDQSTASLTGSESGSESGSGSGSKSASGSGSSSNSEDTSKDEGSSEDDSEGTEEAEKPEDKDSSVFSEDSSESASQSVSASASTSVSAPSLASVPASASTSVSAPSLASGSGNALGSGSQVVQPSSAQVVQSSGSASVQPGVSPTSPAPSLASGSASVSFRGVEDQTFVGNQQMLKSNQIMRVPLNKNEQPTNKNKELEPLKLSKEQNDKSSRKTETKRPKSGTEVRGNTPDDTSLSTPIQTGAQLGTTRINNSTEKSDEETVKEELINIIKDLDLKTIFGNDIGEITISEEFAYYFLGKHLNGKGTANNNDEILKIFNKCISEKDKVKKILNETNTTETIKGELKKEIESQCSKLNEIYRDNFTGKSAMNIILSFSIGTKEDLLQKIVKGEYLGKVDNKDYFDKMSNMQEVMRKLKTTKSRFSKEHRFLKRLKKKMHKKTQRIIKFTKLQKKSQNKQQVLLKMQITRGIYKFLKGGVEEDLSKISREGMLKAIEDKLNKLDESDELFDKNKEMLEKQVDQLMKSFHDSPGNLKSVKKAIMKQLKREENKLAKESGVYGGFLKRAYRFFTFHKFDNKDEAIEDAYKAEEKLQEREADRLGKFKKTDKILQKAWSRLQKIQAKENVKKSVKGLLNTPQTLKISDVLNKRTDGRSQ